MEINPNVRNPVQTEAAILRLPFFHLLDALPNSGVPLCGVTSPSAAAAIRCS
jgi:hypothetical protein